jgi:GT2 family glycosyltransferase
MVTGASPAAQAVRLALRLVLPACWVDLTRRFLYGGGAGRLPVRDLAGRATSVVAAAPRSRSGTWPRFVSIVVPVLNDERGIAACLDALLHQTYPPERCQIIVADNGSSDGTRAVVERLATASGGRIRLVVEATRRSSYAARNRALREVEGEVIALTDADCVPAPTWIQEGVRALEAQGRGTVAGRVTFSYRGDRPNACEYWDSAVHLNQGNLVRRYGFGATANLFIHARTFERYGRFRSDLVSGGDRELGYRLWLGGEPVAYAPDAVVHHPARATLRAAFGKILRLARAHRHLHDLGALRSRFLCLRQLRPVFTCPPPHSWNGELSWAERAMVVGLRNLGGWLTGLICLGHGVTDELRGWRTSRCRPPPD